MEVLVASAIPIISKFLAGYLREQFAGRIAQLEKRDEASEVLVGFVPEISDAEGAQLSISSGASVSRRATTLRSAQEKVDEVAASVLGSVQPKKTELNFPGCDSVEQDLAQLRHNEVDSSWLTNIVRLTATPSMIAKLARMKQVAFMVPNFDIRLPTPVRITEGDVKSARQQKAEQDCTWGLEYLKIPQLWKDGLSGENVLIGHLDTGIDASHPDLKGKVQKFALFDPRGQMFNSDPFDSEDHGTHTAGTIVGGKSGGVAIGVAPKAKLVSALVLMRGTGTIWQIIKGMEWVISQKVRVLNVSLGGLGYNAFYEYALNRIVAMGVFPSCSVGNDGLAVTGSPGNLGQACGVGAIDSDGKVADFSGGGSISWYNQLGQLLEAHKPDIVAPGVAVLSSLPQGKWDYLNGTSMAAPHVSGLIALLIQAKPSATLSALLEALYSTAKHPTGGERPRDSRYGRGVIDPVRALERLKA
jgi:serine protease AprX